MELRAERGRAVLVGVPERFQPPTALTGALDEWAEVAAAVCSDDEIDPATAELVSARGRQLAARLAAEAGIPVRYTDPVRGVPEQVPAPDDRPDLTSDTRSNGFDPPSDPDPLSFESSTPAGSSVLRRPSAAEPTPWATGLTVSAFAAVIVLTAVVTLVSGLAEMDWLFGAFGLVVVTAGLAPSIWLARNTPLWRWVSYGVAGGIALSWVALLLASLGP